MVDARPTNELAAVAALLAKLDICMMTTRASDGGLHGRPMSNNGEVEYDGDSSFFAREGSRARSARSRLIPMSSSHSSIRRTPPGVNLEGRATGYVPAAAPSASGNCGWMTSSDGSRTGRTTLR